MANKKQNKDLIQIFYYKLSPLSTMLNCQERPKWTIIFVEGEENAEPVPWISLTESLEVHVLGHWQCNLTASLIRERWPRRNQQGRPPSAPWARQLIHILPHPWQKQGCSIPFSIHIQCCFYSSFYQESLQLRMLREGVSSKSLWVPIARTTMCAFTSFVIFFPLLWFTSLRFLKASL